MPLLNLTPQPDESPIAQWLSSSESNLVVVVFHASWSGSIEFIKGHLRKISQVHPALVTYWANLDDERAISTQLGVTRVPTLVIFKNREIVDLLVGVHSRKKLASIIDKHLKD